MTRSTGRSKRLLRSAAALIFWLAVWYAAAARVGLELILPSPLTVLKTLGGLCATSGFWAAAGLSLARIFSGFAMGLLLGTALAGATCASGALDALFSPLLRVIRATPVASFIILALLWISRALVPAFISMLMVTPVVWGATAEAVKSADPSLLEAARAYSFGRMKTVRLIYAPSAYPAWRAAAVTSMGLAWKSGVAAEVLCLPRAAVGTELYYSKIYLETPSLFAWTAVVVVLSFLLERLFTAFLRQRRAAA